MKKALKRSLSFLLAITIIFGSAYVGLSEVDFGSIFAVRANAATSGTTGDCTWSLDGTVLTISGNGKMGDYSNANYYKNPAPWGTSITEVIIEDSVTSVGREAFCDCDKLTSITIPDSVTSIGDFAFSFCNSLRYVTIGNSVTSIGERAFEYCRNLSSVTIGNSVKSIGEGAFYQCNGLTRINWNAKNVSENTDFSKVFDNAGNYGSGIKVVFGDTVERIPARLFYVEDGLSFVTSVTIGKNVKSIGSYAFCECTYLTSITIPDSVTGIGYKAFYYTGYYNDSSNWQNKVLYIGNHLIEAKYDLSGSYTIRSGTKTIACQAFYECDKLTSITIPDSVTSIASEAFKGCSSLKNVYITDIAKWCGISFYNNYSNPLLCATNLYLNDELVTDLIIPDGVAKISDYAFYSCNSLTSITISDSVTSIGSSAFKVCTRLKSVIIGNGITSIDANAFYNCTSLTSVTIPDSVTSIGDYAFEYCTKINAVYITDIAKWCGISFSNYSSNPLYYAENLYLNGELVTKLVIPDSVTSIGGFAFYGCKSLASLTIGDGVTSIGVWDFGYCTGLTSVTIPDSVTSIGDYAFYGCKSLTSITIPDSVTSIARWTFRNCESLAAISVDEDNETYCSVDGVLFDKTKTTLVKYPEGKPNTSYIIPDGVTSIGSEAFAFRRNLTSITIPDSVTSIGVCCCDVPGACISFDEIKTSCNSYASKYFHKNILNLSHNTLTDWVIDSYATLYEPGSKHSTCLICGDTVTEAIPQLKTETPKVKAINTIAGMKVTWNAVDGAVKYALYKRLGTANSWTYVTTTTGTSYADNNTPLAGSYYVYTVKAYNSADMASDYIKANCASVQRVVAPVTKAVNKLNGINVTWNKVEGANKYVVLRRIGTESTWKTLCTTTDASFLDNNVTPGIYYIYSIRAVNNTGYSEYDVNKRVTIQRVVAPHTYATNTPKGINVTWNKVAGANKYIVLRRLGTGSVWETICTTTGSSFLDENVTAGVYYLYSIRAVNNMGHSEYDVNKRVTIKRAAYKPATPTVVATNETYGVYIKWSYIKEATKYNVYRSVGNSNNFVLLGTTTNTWFYDENVYNGTNYVYAVRAINDKNISALDTNKTAKIKPVTAPTAMATNHINGVQVKWYSVTGAAQYSVFRRTAGTNTWVFIGTTTGTSLIDKGVKNGTYYEYSIRAINSTGYSAFNYRKTDNIQPITAPTAKVMNKSGSVQVSWNNIANANSYNVYRQISGSSTWVCVGQTKNTSFVDTGVIRGKTYTYSIRAINGTGYSAYDSSKCAVIKYS